MTTMIRMACDESYVSKLLDDYKKATETERAGLKTTLALIEEGINRDIGRYTDKVLRLSKIEEMIRKGLKEF